MFTSGAGFTFQAGARAIDQRPKYRNDQNAPQSPCMITVDPRVYRGSTYSKHRPAQPELQPVNPRPKGPISRAGEDRSFHARQRREDRLDHETQTDPYLQEIFEKPAEVDKSTQTDNFLDRPSTPPWFPPRTGVDAECQVEEAELFDWEFEVEPIVTTIVVKTLEQAFMEVHEEEELANVRRHKEAIEHQRNVELADVQRLEECERRKFEEKQKRIQQRLQHELAQRELRAKIAARGFGEFYSIDVMQDTISLLERRGYFYDEVEREIEGAFLPWLGQAMVEARETDALVCAIVTHVEESVVAYDEQLRAAAAEEHGARNQDERAEKLTNFRRMLVEDLGAAKIRIALGGRPKRRRTRNLEEEDGTDSGAYSR
jgi:hypothetical protein